MQNSLVQEMLKLKNIDVNLHQNDIESLKTIVAHLILENIQLQTALYYTKSDLSDVKDELNSLKYDLQEVHNQIRSLECN